MTFVFNYRNHFSMSVLFRRARDFDSYHAQFPLPSSGQRASFSTLVRSFEQKEKGVSHEMPLRHRFLSGAGEKPLLFFGASIRWRATNKRASNTLRSGGETRGGFRRRTNAIKEVISIQSLSRALEGTNLPQLSECTFA